MLTLTTITYKLDERFRLEFTNDWEGKYYHLQIINGDLTPLCYIPPASSGSVLCISGIPTGYSSSRIYELLVKNTYWIGKIYLLDAPKWLMNKIEEVKACNEDFGLSFAIEKHNANNIHNITPNLSKYIPEDNAVLFLSLENESQYGEIFQDVNSYYTYPKIECEIEGYSMTRDYNKVTIFISHGTQSELQKANEVGKYLEENFGIKPDVFALHWFKRLKNNDWRFNFLRNIIEEEENAKGIWHGNDFGKFVESKYEERIFINKIITTNSTGILKPEDSSECLQVIDAKEIFEEYLKENNLI